MRKFIACIMVFVVLLSLNVTVFASGKAVDIRRDIYLPGNWNVVLNCYTSGTVVDGTLVSTWSRTGNLSQCWVSRAESGGRCSIRSQAAPSLAINANRSYIGTQVNVIAAKGNRLEDYAFVVTPGVLQAGRFGLSANDAHTQRVYITRHGNANICTWQYAGSTSTQNWMWEDY